MAGTLMSDHERWMRVALKLAGGGSGLVSPNPLVGCVVVQNGLVIGQGWHERVGGAHAEVNALGGIDMLPPDAIVYVNLEPCSHTGRTPPCADLLIRKGARNVVIGMADPNPLVSGRGITALRAAGADVTVGVLEDECRWLNRWFIRHIVTGLPYLTLKMAQTLDGIVAHAERMPMRITSTESERAVHELRAAMDAVLVGAGTVLADDPQLTVRAVAGRNPVRIVADAQGRLVPGLRLVRSARDSSAATIVVVTEEHATNLYRRPLEDAGVQVIVATDVMAGIAAELPDIASILCEGGPLLAADLLRRHDVVNELHVHIAPVTAGHGLPWWPPYMERRWDVRRVDSVGPDVHLTMLPRNETEH